MTEEKYIKPKFTIIRTRNNLNVAETVNGERVYRSEKIWIPQANRYIMCAPYDNHFIFFDAKNLGWATFCTCGSPAVLVGYKVYETQASPTSGEGVVPGELLICKHHADFGKHLDGSS